MNHHSGKYATSSLSSRKNYVVYVHTEFSNMWESTTNFSLANIQYAVWCQYNEARLFYNVTDLSYCQCNATILADPDIAGIGVRAKTQHINWLVLY